MQSHPVYQDEWRSVTTIHDLLFRDFFLCRRVGDPFSPAGLPADRSICLSRSRVTEHEREQRGKERNEREREREKESTGGRGQQSRTSREVKPLLPKRIMRGKIKFFSTRPFELHRPRDHALLLLVLYTVYTFRGSARYPPSPQSSPFSSIALFVVHFRRREPRDYTQKSHNIILISLLFYNFYLKSKKSLVQVDVICMFYFKNDI